MYINVILVSFGGLNYAPLCLLYCKYNVNVYWLDLIAWLWRLLMMICCGDGSSMSSKPGISKSC